MADVDDELLALVGGDDGSDDESGQEMNISRSGSESPEPDAKAAATKEKKSSTPKPGRRRHDDSDEEEGEASSVASSPTSQKSAPMDESDSETEALHTATANANATKVDDDDDNKYPFEGIYASEAEKEDILAMPELEREQLLARRQEEVDRQRQNTLLRRLLKTREDDSQSAKKRKASSVDLDDAQRKTSRQRTRVGGSKVGETSAGIESLRRARAEKNDRQRRREEDRERNKGKSAISFQDSPGHDDDDSEVEWAGGSRRRASRSPEIREIPPASLRDMERIRLGRTRFGQVCFYPGFDNAITGCYVRIAIGPDREGENVYRMAVIKGFAKGKPYAMEKPNGNSFVTDQYIRAAHGKAEREWPFISCSDSPFTEGEFNRYQRACQDDGVIIPKKPHLSAKIDDIERLRNRTWTETEVNAKIQRERELKEKFAPTERTRLLNSLEDAKHRGDEARISELQDKLDALETPRLAFKTSLTPTKKSASSTPSQQDRLAQLNAENRRRNAEAVRKAQIMERAKMRHLESRNARGEDVEKSTPTNGSGTSTPANGTPKLDATTKVSVLPHLQKLQQQNHVSGKDKKGIPTIHKPLVDDDIIAALDLDIEVEID